MSLNLHRMCPRLQDILSRHSQRQRTVLFTLGVACSVSLIFVIFVASRNLSPIEEEDYHPMQERYLHGKHAVSRRKDEALFNNELRSHDFLVRHFKNERLMKLSSSENRSSSSNMPPQSAVHKTSNCSSRQSNYPFSSLQGEAGDSFSIIILTYNRTDLLLRLLNHYSAMPHLERIVVVWNCLEMTPPVGEWDQLGPHPVPVEFKVQRENQLRNRLQVFPKVKSSALFLVDDDLLISARDIEFAFRVWKVFPHLIVGFYPRKHVRSPITGVYSYGSDELDSLTELGSLSYSMVLTGAAFVHKQYVRMFNDRSVVPGDVHELIDSRNNCEDIAMNVMVGQYLLGELGRPHCSGLFIKPMQLQNLEKETNSGYRGLWRDPTHLAERSYCLNRLAAIYRSDNLPLFYSDLAVVPAQRAMTKWTYM